MKFMGVFVPSTVGQERILPRPRVVFPFLCACAVLGWLVGYLA